MDNPVWIGWLSLSNLSTTRPREAIYYVEVAIIKEKKKKKKMFMASGF